MLVASKANVSSLRQATRTNSKSDTYMLREYVSCTAASWFSAMGHLPRTYQELEEMIFTGQLKIMGREKNGYVPIEFKEASFKAVKSAGAYFFVIKSTWRVRPCPWRARTASLAPPET